ncbi:hypothetical protein [Clostridium botulinum]|uniref:hypothetical protein n=1 Tax=Clostridium botulinum TaxID=1491 RepID=UPI001E4F09F2|nr:hypothetical protein [Clostridium botulinum]MCD3252502.1 hypothetical protein [Clostridium botulinum C/D]MCD3277834.1 hypothetical protein [Clostridium botulinum C/D]MCD3281283.1 hypothetical protein [Clostridium botulinum C/D]MCD3340318.1 hypothetical protein [Clostridium botulinum C/D]MCD3355760.1 hypothetical protein [Clostridium botulinum C/D]
MDLSDLFLCISILFLIGAIFFICKKVDFVDRLEAIFICLSGSFSYGLLCGGYYSDEFDYDIVWILTASMSIIITVFFLIRKPKYLKRWEVVIFGSIEFIISCLMVEPVSGSITKYIC